MGFKVDVSEREAAAGDRSSLPIGKFHMAITNVETGTPAQGDNVGRPMLIFEFTVQDSDLTSVQLPDASGRLQPPKQTNDFVNRKDFVNAMCWEGALYTIVNILKAMGKYQDCLDNQGKLDIPSDPEFYLGEQMIVRRGINKKSQQANPDNPDYWVQAQGFSPVKGAAAVSAGASSSGEGSLLP